MTKAGKRLVELLVFMGVGEEDALKIMVERVEADASEQGVKEWTAHGVDLENDRIRKSIEGLEPAHSEKDPEVSNWYFDGWYEAQEAALEVTRTR